MNRNRVKSVDPENIVSSTLRMPEPLRNEITQVADANKRSANAEIVDRLERSLKASTNVENHAIQEYLERQFAELKASIAELARELRDRK